MKDIEKKDKDGNIIFMQKTVKIQEYEVVLQWEIKNSKLSIVINDELGDSIEGIEISDSE